MALLHHCCSGDPPPHRCIVPKADPAVCGHKVPTGLASSSCPLCCSPSAEQAHLSPSSESSNAACFKKPQPVPSAAISCHVPTVFVTASQFYLCLFLTSPLRCEILERAKAAYSSVCVCVRARACTHVNAQLHECLLKPEVNLSATVGLTFYLVYRNETFSWAG